MSTFTFKIAGVVLVALSVSSCGLFGGDERPVYQGAEYYKNLEVPPDLTEPDTGDQLRVPKPTDEALARFRDNNKLQTVITPKFDGVRMVSYAGESWIEVDNTVEHVWAQLIKFWEGEGIELVQERPLLGFMETDWTERLVAKSGFFKSMLQKLEPDQKDKFRVRVERFDDGQNTRGAKTRVFIAHSRIERATSGEDGDLYIWKSQPSNLEAEREIISRMALFAGLDNEQSMQILNNYRPYSSLVKIDSANTIALTMTGSMDFVWRRAMRALNRMRMQDIREEKENSTIHFAVTKISDEDVEIEEDELSKTSWLMQLFTSTDETNLAANENRKYRLVFSEVNGRIQITVKDIKDSTSTDEDGAISGTALAEQLRNILAKNLE